MKISPIILFVFFCFLAQAGEAAPLKIHLFSVKNGKGLEASREILKNELEALGHLVYEKDLKEKKCKNCPKVDLNIFFETINPRWLNLAAVNWFIPNPEWYDQSLPLDQIDLILCRTREVERVFNALNQRTSYIGFSSRDCLCEGIEKDYNLCLHVAGGSHYKGTKAILKAWEGRGELPHLTLLTHLPIHCHVQPNVEWIRERLQLPDLRIYQNSCGIHLCPSETEGFGHYLMEAMSTGAIVITTDAPPMNEFIEDERCLVPYSRTAQCMLATRYFVDPEELVKRIENLMALPAEELKRIGNDNRARYLKKSEEFHSYLKQLMDNEFP